jgi:Ubiquitin interaction motif
MRSYSRPTFDQQAIQAAVRAKLASTVMFRLPQPLRRRTSSEDRSASTANAPAVDDDPDLAAAIAASLQEPQPRSTASSIAARWRDLAPPPEPRRRVQFAPLVTVQWTFTGMLS